MGRVCGAGTTPMATSSPRCTSRGEADMNRLQSHIVGHIVADIDARTSTFVTPVDIRLVREVAEAVFDGLERDAHRRIITTLVDVHPSIAEAYDTNPEL